MNICENVSRFLHQKETSRKHPTKRTIGTKELLMSLVGLELVAAGFLAACSPGVESPTGNNGVKGYYAWKALYYYRGPDFKQPAQDPTWRDGTWDKNECPDTQEMWYKIYVEEPGTCQAIWYPFGNQ